MAFNSKTFGLIAPAFTKGKGPSIWSYDATYEEDGTTAGDVLADINTSGYFPASIGLRGVSNGDVVFVRDSSAVVATCYVVDAATTGAFDLTDGVVITATDSD
jgi:hypothetical protein